MSLLLAVQGVQALAVTSVAALPLGGVATFATPIAVASTRALPRGGSVILADPLVLGSVRALPEGGTGSLAVRVALGSSAPTPLGGAVILSSTSVVLGSVGLDVGPPRQGRRPQVRVTPGRWRDPTRHLVSRAALPLRAETHVTLEELVSADADAATEDAFFLALVD